MPKGIPGFHPTCNVPGCPESVHGQGLCNRHYRIWRKHGDPLYVRLVPSPLERFWAKVDRRGPDVCWPWTGAILRNGYGYFSLWHGKAVLAHRWIYQQIVGPIPQGLRIDHQCHNRDTSCPGGSVCLHRRCQNPAHLEPATTAENNRRGQAGAAVAARQQAKTHCPEGHAYSPENTYRDPQGHRHCRTCVRKQDRERKRRYRAM